MDEHTATEIAYKNGYNDGIKELAATIKKYYRYFDAKPHPASIEYYIDQKVKEMLKGNSTGIETCVVCGDSIPEGRQVCPKCEVAL